MSTTLDRTIISLDFSLTPILDSHTQIPPMAHQLERYKMHIILQVTLNKSYSAKNLQKVSHLHHLLQSVEFVSQNCQIIVDFYFPIGISSR